MNLIFLTDFIIVTVNEDKLQNWSVWGFLLRYLILVKIWEWLKLLKSNPFIKKTFVNHVYIRISSFWLTFTVLKWLKTNLKISQFSGFLLRSKYAIQVKIWKWLKLLNGAGLRSFSHVSNFEPNQIPLPEQKSSNWLILKFVFIHCKTVKVSQNEQIRFQTWFTSVFLMNRTELRSFSHY